MSVEPSWRCYAWRADMKAEQEITDRFVVGGVDTHKDVNVAAAVDEAGYQLAD